MWRRLSSSSGIVLRVTGTTVGPAPAFSPEGDRNTCRTDKNLMEKKRRSAVILKIIIFENSVGGIACGKQKNTKKKKNIASYTRFSREKNRLTRN